MKANAFSGGSCREEASAWLLEVCTKLCRVLQRLWECVTAKAICWVSDQSHVLYYLCGAPTITWKKRKSHWGPENLDDTTFAPSADPLGGSRRVLKPACRPGKACQGYSKRMWSLSRRKCSNEIHPRQPPIDQRVKACSPPQNLPCFQLIAGSRRACCKSFL